MERLLEAVRRVRSDGYAVEFWSFQLTESSRMSLGTKDRRTGNAHAPLTLAEGLSASFKLVWSDGKVSRGSLERRQIEHEAEESLRVSRAAAYDDPDAAWVNGPAAIPDIPLYDDGVAAIASGSVLPLSERLDLIRGRVASCGARTWSGAFHASSARSRLVTSEGFDASTASTSASWSATLDGEIGGGWSARSLEPHEGFSSRLDRLVDLLVRLRRPGPARPGGVVPTLFHPDVVEEYVIGALLHNLDGATVAHGEGAFRREQFGSKDPVLRPDLTLRVDPTRPLASGAYRFSSEGVPAAPCDLVRNGRLVTPVLDLKYSRRLGLPPTALPVAMDTLHLEAAEAWNLDRAIETAAGGVFVLGVLGVHTQDFSSGDFSLAAPQALAVDGPGLGGRLRATLSGNLFDMLRDPGTRLVRFEGESTPGLLATCRVDSRSAAVSSDT